MPTKAIQIDPRDNVAVIVEPLMAGEPVGLSAPQLCASETIPKGHKIALKHIAAGEEILKYGWPIGRATAGIAPGAHVHSHNLKTNLSGIDRYEPPRAPPRNATSPKMERAFQGYRRPDGSVGTRNEIWILPTVGCVARAGEKIAAEANRRFSGRVDGVYAFTHPFGCSQLGDDLGRTRNTLAALANHPNAGGALIIGLGCESNQLSELLEAVPGSRSDRIRAFNAQLVADELEEGVAAVEALVEIAEQTGRTPHALANLRIGLKCGGSDGLSGVTANPLLGRIADELAAAGGTPILTEIPEIFGAERLLMDRAVDNAVFSGIVDVVNDFKRYFIANGHPIYENPSPGNIAGGITTLEEKSLGAVQKAGRAPVHQVLRYGERATCSGLALLEAPGNDAISSTALVAAGATLILFTTGCGTPLGSPVPTLKVASNSALARAKPRWIDYDAGAIARGKSIDIAAEELMALVLDTASGMLARNEKNDERSLALWKGGVTL